MRRIAFYLFYDASGEVDDYIPFKLTALQEFVQDIIVVCNSPITEAGRAKLENIGVQIFCRENIGFDVWGYKEGLESIGYDKLADSYDEVILLNYTFFGPIFPFSELFNEMDSRECDFWGISDHSEVTPNPFTGRGVLPRHIQSHFIAARSRMLKSAEFRKYWQEMPMIRSYEDSVLTHESRFTSHFESRGFTSSVYINKDDYPSLYPTFFDIKETIKNRSPILKRRLFFHNPLWMDANYVDLRGTMDIIKATSSYDVNLINQNINRTVKPRDLYTNLEQLRILPTEYHFRENYGDEKHNLSVAVVAHVYYSDMWDELYSFIKNIPCEFDLYISTSTQSDAEVLREHTKKLKQNVDIRVVEENRGRDMSSLFITFKDVGLNDKYDYICRLHTKKMSEDGFARNEFSKVNVFKHHLYENLLGTPEYISNLLGFMRNNSDIGIVCPPVMHIGNHTMGHGWGAVKTQVSALCKDLDIVVPLDDDTPVAVYGTMFWFKPQALRPLFQRNWKWNDFDEEPVLAGEGIIPVLERVICCVAKNEGYSIYNVMTPGQAERNYTKLEFKHQKIMSTLPSGDASWQYSCLKMLFKNGDGKESSFFTVLSGCVIILLSVFKQNLIEKHPRWARVLRGPYLIAKNCYKHLRVKKNRK